MLASTVLIKEQTIVFSIGKHFAVETLVICLKIHDCFPQELYYMNHIFLAIGTTIIVTIFQNGQTRLSDV